MNIKGRALWLNIILIPCLALILLQCGSGGSDGDTPSGCTNDIDGDVVCDGVDNCPDDANEDQIDTDSDGLGDICDVCKNDPDNDIDGDTICGDVDICPGDPDNDIDGDVVCGDVDNCPDDANAGQGDADIDGFGDICDFCPSDPANECCNSSMMEEGDYSFGVTNVKLEGCWKMALVNNTINNLLNNNLAVISSTVIDLPGGDYDWPLILSPGDGIEIPLIGEITGEINENTSTDGLDLDIADQPKTIELDLAQTTLGMCSSGTLIMVVNEIDAHLCPKQDGIESSINAKLVSMSCGEDESCTCNIPLLNINNVINSAIPGCDITADLTGTLP